MIDCWVSAILAHASARRLLLEEGPGADAYSSSPSWSTPAVGRPPPSGSGWRPNSTNRADVWLNLGNVLAESGDAEDAACAFRLAVQADPGYADARAELANTLDRLGDEAAARPHWRAYLALEPDGPWASYARSRLDESLGA